MTEEDLFAHIVRAIRALVPPEQLISDLDNPFVGADYDLLQSMLMAGGPDHTIRLWRRPKSLITSRRLAQKREFPEAAEASARRGWPVEVRQSAGLTVAHHPGVLNIACLTILPPDFAGLQVSSVYDDLLDLMVGACRGLGVETGRGAVEGAYCDGSQNLTFAGRKLAGASARLIRASNGTGILSHASLTVYGNVEEDVAAVRAFEQALGLDANYSPAAHCSLVDALTSMSRPPRMSSSSSCDRGPSLRSSLGDRPNFSL